MTLGLRGILERIRKARSNGINQKIRGEWVVFAMVDSETCVKGMEKAWRSRDDSWLVGEQDGDLLETINNLRWELWKTVRGLVIICQVPGHAKGVGGISAVAMVDAVAKWAAEGVPREPDLLVRRSIATMMGVTDYGRVDGGGQDTLSSLAIGGKVFSEVAKRLQMLWAREMIQEKLRDEDHSGRNHMLFDLARAGITTVESGEEARWTTIRSLLLKGVGARARPSGEKCGYSAMLQTIGAASRVNWKLDKCKCGQVHDVRHFILGEGGWVSVMHVHLSTYIHMHESII